MKKKKSDNGKRIDHLDTFHRMNFLYQAAHLCSSNNAEELGRLYSYQLKQVAQRVVVRMDPIVKRTICKKCSSVLIPGKTSQVFIDKKETECKTICQFCSRAKTLPINEKYIQFSVSAAVDDEE